MRRKRSSNKRWRKPRKLRRKNNRRVNEISEIR
jgi:hypothetical protein